MPRRKKRSKAKAKWIDAAWFLIVVFALGASVKSHLRDRDADQTARAKRTYVISADVQPK